MASIVKRGSKYSVVYNYENEKGMRKQKWETFATHTEAKKRKIQVEFKKSTKTFIAPSAKTLRNLLEEYVSIYGINTWALSTYEARRALIDNYINPLIGSMKLDKITPKIMDDFYRNLRTVEAKSQFCRENENKFVSARVVKEIHKVLSSAFNQAIKWELIERNPVSHATLPKCSAATREIWTADILFEAVKLCNDEVLTLALNLAFSCSLRMGEMLGLTWSCVDISEENIRKGCASILVNKELQRVTKQALLELENKDVIKIFPAVIVSKHTSLVLKLPKTKTSIRKIFLPNTVARMLAERKKYLEEMKELQGNEFVDNDLVFCNVIGKPMEGQVINRALNQLIRENGLPKIVFHSLRHSSITYKLKLTGGDMKAVQGDSGHSRVQMVADVYSHILDDDRQINAQRFEEEFYRDEKAEENGGNIERCSVKEILLKLTEKPEIVELLKALL